MAAAGRRADDDPDDKRQRADHQQRRGSPAPAIHRRGSGGYPTRRRHAQERRRAFRAVRCQLRPCQGTRRDDAASGPCLQPRQVCAPTNLRPSPAFPTRLRSGMARIWVIIPTYNEAANLDGIVRAATAALERAVAGEYRVLVVDDNSPDGTGAIADSLAAELEHRRGAAPARQERSRPGLPGGLSARARLRGTARDRDGRRLLPRSALPARSDRRRARRRRGARLALRGGRRRA